MRNIQEAHMTATVDPNRCTPGSNGKRESPRAQPELAGVYEHIAELMQSIHREIAEMRAPSPLRITAGAVTHIPGTSHAAMTVAPARGEMRSVGLTDATALLLERIQQRHFEGPAIEAARGHHLCLADDLSADPRWSNFRTAVTSSTPVRSILSIPLAVSPGAGVALNLYADTTGAFTAEGQHIATVFATHAAIAIDSGNRVRHYRQALTRRDAIGQAKGMLMERFSLDAATAFSLLAKLAQEHETSVAVTARQMVWHKRQKSTPDRSDQESYESRRESA
jgi:GAF domain-containing protein